MSAFELDQLGCSQCLKRPVDVDCRKADGVADFALGYWKAHGVIPGKADHTGADKQLATQMRQTLNCRASTNAGYPLAKDCSFDQGRAPKGSSHAPVACTQLADLFMWNEGNLAGRNGADVEIENGKVQALKIGYSPATWKLTICRLPSARTL